MSPTNENQDGVRIPLDYSDLETSDLFAVDPPECLFHYTTPSSAAGIIESKSLWLTKIQYLNDTSELELAISLFKDAINRRSNKLNDKEKSDFLIYAGRQIDSFRKTNICVSSFCENGDLLSQWRAYGSSGSGVALGFSGQRLKDLQNRGFLNIWKCIYQPRIHEKLAKDLVKILENSFDVCRQNLNLDNWEKTKEDLIGYFNTTFLRVAPVFKNEHFEEEKEWRLITTPMKITDKNYRTIFNDSYVSQVYVVDFEKQGRENHDFISKVIIGPAADPDRISATLFVLVRKDNFGSVSFSPSLIPFRNSL